MSTQIRLMQVAYNLKLTQCIQIPRDVMRKAAEENLSSLLYDHVRSSDIVAMAAKMEESWGVTCEVDHMSGNYTMCKVHNA